jgi:very-short-patch-repair endonuclease
MDIDLAIDYTENNRNYPTKSELIIKGKLERLGINFIFQYPVIIKNKLYILDFYLPDNKLYIEVDGSTHNSESAKRYDNIRKQAINKELHIREVRIKNNHCESVILINILRQKKKHKKAKNKAKKQCNKQFIMSTKDRLLQDRYDKLLKRYK